MLHFLPNGGKKTICVHSRLQWQSKNVKWGCAFILKTLIKKAFCGDTHLRLTHTKQNKKRRWYYGVYHFSAFWRGWLLPYPYFVLSFWSRLEQRLFVLGGRVPVPASFPKWPAWWRPTKQWLRTLLRCLFTFFRPLLRCSEIPVFTFFSGLFWGGIFDLPFLFFGTSANERHRQCSPARPGFFIPFYTLSRGVIFDSLVSIFFFLSLRCACVEYKENTEHLFIHISPVFIHHKLTPVKKGIYYGRFEPYAVKKGLTQRPFKLS